MSERVDVLKAAVRARPVRVAYLVEEAANSHAVLDAVFAECHSRWGGRFSLVVPFVPSKGGEPDAAYVHWLEVYDPDVLYVYGNVTEDALAQLRDRFGPAYLVKHQPRDNDESNARCHRPEMPIALLSSLSVALQYCRAFAPSAPRPMLVPDSLPGFPSDRFVDDNFGTPSGSLLRWPLPESLADAVRPISLGTPEHLAKFSRGGPPLELVPDAVGMLRAMAERRNSYGIAQLAADSAPRVEIAGDCSGAFSIVAGDAFADRILFWNQRGLMPSYIGRGMASLIVSPARLGDANFFDALITFLKTRNEVPRSGNGGPLVRIRSASLDQPQLNELRRRFQSADNSNAYSVADSLRPEAMVPSQRALEEARGLHFLRGFERQPAWKEFSTEGSAVQPPSPVPGHLTGVQASNAATHGCWALDVDVERRVNHSRYSNVIHRWRLPVRLHMHGAFCRPWMPPGDTGLPRSARSAREGFLVVFVGLGEDPPELTIPSDETAFRHALEAGNAAQLLLPPGSASSMRGPFALARPSDKGRYLTGTLQLFGGLQSAGRFLLHGYWQQVFDALGGGVGTARHNEIKGTLRSRLGDAPLTSEGAWDRLVRLVMTEARRVRIPLRKLSFDELRARHAPYVARLRQRVAESSAARIEEEICRAQGSLTGGVQELCSRAVLYQGYEWRCEACFHTNWNALGQLSPKQACDVCGEAVFVPVDKAWDFRLNGFIREALKEHGILALVWCLSELEGRARDAFFFLGPHELHSEIASPRTYREADLICVVDRRVHLCEVKSSDRDVDLESLVAIATRMRPDVVTLAVMDDASPRLNAKFQQLQQALDPAGLRCELVTKQPAAVSEDAYLL